MLYTGSNDLVLAVISEPQSDSDILDEGFVAGERAFMDCLYLTAQYILNSYSHSRTISCGLSETGTLQFIS